MPPCIPLLVAAGTYADVKEGMFCASSAVPAGSAASVAHLRAGSSGPLARGYSPLMRTSRWEGIMGRTFTMARQWWTLNQLLRTLSLASAPLRAGPMESYQFDFGLRTATWKTHRPVWAAGES